MSDEQENMVADIGRRPLTRRGFIMGVGAAGVGMALGPLLASCGGDTTTTTAGGGGGTPKMGGSLKVGIVGGGAKDTLDPHVATTEPDIAFSAQLYDSLMGWNQDYVLENRLAEDVTANAEATVWTVKLRSGLTWHDGSPVTADDVVYTFNRIVDPAAPLSGAASLGGLQPEDIVKIDDLTVEFRLATANAILTEGFAYRQNMLVPAGFDPANPVGCGPFKLNEFRPGEQVTFTRFDEYWDEGPYVDDLTIIEFADEAARVNAFLSNTVDMISQLPRAQVGAVEASAGHLVLRANTGAWQPFTMRIDQAPFDDVRVRQAFRLIVDREQMLQQAYSGYGWVGNDMYAPFDLGYPSDLPQRKQDLEQAKALLTEAGYADGLTVELVTSDAVGGSAVSAAQVFAEQAKGANVTVNVNKVDPGVFYGDDYLTWTFSQDFWYTRNYLAQAAAGTLPTAPYNETHWQDDEWQALVEEAYRTPDDDKRNDLVRQAMTIEYERGGLIVWAFNDQIDAYNEKLGGVLPDKQGTPLTGFRFSKVYFA